MADKMNISGARVRYYRKKLGLSQHQLAVRAQLAGWDIGRDVVVKVETGVRGLGDIECAKFCLLLECTPNDLIALDEVKLATVPF